MVVLFFAACAWRKGLGRFSADRGLPHSWLGRLPPARIYSSAPHWSRAGGGPQARVGERCLEVDARVEGGDRSRVEGALRASPAGHLGL